MSQDSRKDLPPVTAPNFQEKVREALSTYLGSRGDKLDRGVTLRDLTDSGIVTLGAGFLGSGRGAPISGPGSAIPAPSSGGGGTYVPDLTPPPTATGFTATAAISNVLVECAPQIYAAGHGHGRSKLYGATWTGGALPVFADAEVITEFQGNVTSYATNPATTWHLWLTWVTVDGVESSVPAGGTNGVVVTTGQDVSAMVAAMTGTGNPFTILDTPTVIDGVTFPSGTYSTNAFIQDAQITNAKIKNLAVDDAKIANMSVAKLTAGTMGIGAYIQSTNYTSGPSGTGFRINADGTAEMQAAYIRGQITASQIDSRGLSIKDAYGNVILSSGSSIQSQINPYTSGATANITTKGPLSLRPAGADGDFYYATDVAYLYQKLSGTWVQSANNFNNTSQLIDGAGLGYTATWAGVSGSGKPQDYATANQSDSVTNSAISARLAKSGSDILTGPISLNAATAILVGNTTDGLYLGNTGIVGRKAGVTTFSVDQAGNATFAGSLAANTATFTSIVSKSATEFGYDVASGVANSVWTAFPFYMEHAGVVVAIGKIDYSYTSTAGTYNFYVDIDGYGTYGTGGTNEMPPTMVNFRSASLSAGWHNVNVWAHNGSYTGSPGHLKQVTILRSYK